ncbi:Glycosyltransferase involved in cell wall bisynthesis [Flavobacterium sp. CF108]|uniref:glycosyltransferase n=1 Tax=unclassified Flavobacterium TaxID=196869 RepID=UPI0008BC84C0|nr:MULTISPECIES: glycosyltransferase [unclassified Flavobacterium]SEO48773.1 Glycosyltransferase involved in cell wall bisynthesis [Flavobacterium sp. fv08]SHH71735.1 Glycosyltransferase involved in cell wall bisynthesis [Flavobacterium sp. CF108]
MRVVQIIDSLEAGGAERMAVNYANALSGKIKFSGLIATRKQGQLVKQINGKVSYLFLNKKKAIDIKSTFRLRKYIKSNKVEIIHAHGSSFFIAVLVKLTLPRIKIFWHDHYGTRIKESKFKNKTLISLSLFFYSIFVVSNQLKEWNKKNMLCKRVTFVPNFTTEKNDLEKTTNLKGIEGKRIVFLANLKNPKNHILILKSFFELGLKDSDWSLHLIGKDYFDAYSESIKSFIKSNSLEKHIHLYGERNDIPYVLSQGTIGVLSSTEEGFPVTLLEYGLAGLAVVTTNVGYCSEIIKNDYSGLLFNPENELEVKSQLLKITGNEPLRKRVVKNLKQSILNNYSEEEVINKLILLYKSN